MHYAIEIVPFGEYADPCKVIPLAQAAEAAGWEGLFVWDHLAYVFGFPGADPWVTLAAVAAVTTRLKLGTDVTPLPRRRPQVLAQTLVTLDLLSQGRAILGVGLGGVEGEFTSFGEPGDARQRAAMADEALEILDRLMSGEVVAFHGKHYTVENVTLSPLPVQRPRIPFWIGGDSRPALRRAARWDGWVAGGVNEEAKMVLSPQALAEKVAYIQMHRTQQAPFEIAITGCSQPGQSALTGEYADAGATWWLESLFGLRGSMQEMMDRVKAGPPG